MSKYFAILLTSLVLYGCGGSNYTISGKADLTPGDTLLLHSPYESDSVLAIAVVGCDSSFLICGSVATPTIANLVHNGRRIATPILLEAADIRLVTTGDVRGYQFTGTPLNDAFNAMNAKQVALGDTLQAMEYKLHTPEQSRIFDSLSMIYRQIPAETMEANGDNLLGAFLYARRGHTNATEARERLAQFPTELQHHPVLEDVRRQIEAIERSSVGSPCTDLTLRNAAGGEIALSSLVESGRWVLLEFWATWCHSCVAEMPGLREVYAAYKDKGVEIYGISLDNDEARWKAFVAENNMPWVNVLGINPEKGSVAAERYGISHIPSNFLISPEGIIVAKNLHGDTLKKQLKELIK